MMNEPILEALSFAFDKELLVDNPTNPSTSLNSQSPHRTQHNAQTSKNSQTIRPSKVILGECCKTPCLIANCQFITEPLLKKENKDAFLAHLLTEHRIVIDDVDKIANLHKYIIHWKERFLNAPITEFCVGFVMDELPKPPPLPVSKRRQLAEGDVSEMSLQSSQDIKKEKLMYYMLTPALEEDKQLRSTIWNTRLETILDVNRQEREQTDFSRQCFFCKEAFKGNRSLLFEHLKVDHSFRIGKPDNIVFVEEFLELISGKLKQLKCLSCEKVFKDKTVLRDHMRKKGHKKLNSDNPEYNRYYIINYLEPGKDWKVLEEEAPEDERVEEDWLEANEEKASIVCLLCSEQSTNFDDTVHHMKTKHCFDFARIVSTCDFYQKVKIVNFIRRTVFLNTCLFCEKKFLERTILAQHIKEHMQQATEFPSPRIWDQPEYFFPTYENDQFLVFLDKDNDAEYDVDSIISSEDEAGRYVIPEDPPNISLASRDEINKMDFS